MDLNWLYLNGINLKLGEQSLVIQPAFYKKEVLISSGKSMTHFTLDIDSKRDSTSATGKTQENHYDAILGEGLAQTAVQ